MHLMNDDRIDGETVKLDEPIPVALTEKATALMVKNAVHNSEPRARRPNRHKRRAGAALARKQMRAAGRP